MLTAWAQNHQGQFAQNCQGEPVSQEGPASYRMICVSRDIETQNFSMDSMLLYQCLWSVCTALFKALGHSAANLTCLQCQLVSGYCACDATVMVNLTWPSAESEHMPAFIGNQWTNLCGKSVKTVQFASASSHLHFFGWYYCLKQNCTHQLLRNVQHIGRFCIRKGQKK